MVMRREGKGGKTSLSTPHPAGVECGSEEGRTKRFRDEEEAGRDSGGPGSRGRRHGSTGLARGLGVGDSAPDTGKVTLSHVSVVWGGYDARIIIPNDINKDYDCGAI